MAKRKITASEVQADLRAGFDDFALMKKYHLSAAGLQSLLNKMINSGAITPTELEDRFPNLEKTVELGLFFCSACGNTESVEFTACPRCGFSPPGQMRKQASEKSADKMAPSQSTGARVPGASRRSDSGLSVNAESLSTGIREGLEALPSSSSASCFSPGADELPELQRIGRYTQVLSIAAVVAYALVIVALTGVMWLYKPAESLPVYHWFLGILILGVPSTVVAFVVVVTLRALALSIKILQGLVDDSAKNA